MKQREKELNTYFISHGVDPKEHDGVAIRNVKIIFADYLKQKTTDIWKSMEADMKQEYFKAKYPQFFDSFPIVVKLMIQQDKFEISAFKRFLEKCRTNVSEGSNPYSQNMPKKGTQRLTPNEEKWLENQAFYFRYLVEDYRRRIGQRTTINELNWLQAKQLETLRAEMMDFRSNFEKVAEKLKSNHVDNDEKLLMKYIEQVKNGETDLTDEEQENIAFAVEQIVKRREEIKAKIKETELTSEKPIVDIDLPVSDTALVSDDVPRSVPKPKTSSLKLKKARLMKLVKKMGGDYNKLSKDDQVEYDELKKLFSKNEQVTHTKEKLNAYDERLIKINKCYCLSYKCEKCTVKLTNDEKNLYDKKIKEIKLKNTSLTIYESFIDRCRWFCWASYFGPSFEDYRLGYCCH